MTVGTDKETEMTDGIGILAPEDINDDLISSKDNLADVKTDDFMDDSTTDDDMTELIWRSVTLAVIIIGMTFLLLWTCGCFKRFYGGGAR